MVTTGDPVAGSAAVRLAGSAAVRLVDSGAHRRVLAVTGTVDRRGVEDLHEACCPDRLPAGGTVVLDFTGMTGCPSALLLALVRIRDRLGDTRTLQLVGLTEALQAIALGDVPATR